MGWNVPCAIQITIIIGGLCFVHQIIRTLLPYLIQSRTILISGASETHIVCIDVSI